MSRTVRVPTSTKGTNAKIRPKSPQIGGSKNPKNNKYKVYSKQIYYYILLYVIVYYYIVSLYTRVIYYI